MHVTCPDDAGLVDEQQKVRTITALAIAALAEAATPYGIESFDSVLVPLWKGIRAHRGKVCVVCVCVHVCACASVTCFFLDKGPNAICVVKGVDYPAALLGWVGTLIDSSVLTR